MKKAGNLIDRLISLIENSEINQTDKLKIIKVLLSVKLKLVELLKNEIRAVIGGDQSAENAAKQELILEFIKQNRGRVSRDSLLGLGIAGRSLRRYLKNLKDQNKIKIEKTGRNYFYLLI